MSSQADFITMMIPGFTTPGSTTLRRAVPFHDNMDMLFGEWSGGGEIALWFGSVLSGIMFCKLVRFCANYVHIVQIFLSFQSITLYFVRYNYTIVYTSAST